MKRTIIALLAVALFASCQKEDENGALGGFWKILEIEKPDGSIENTVEESRFWGIQLNLLELPPTENSKVYHYCRFSHVGDSLFVQTINANSNLQEFGIYDNKNERYKVEQLSDRRMVLRSKYAKIRFRKF